MFEKKVIQLLVIALLLVLATGCAPQTTEPPTQLPQVPEEQPEQPSAPPVQEEPVQLPPVEQPSIPTLATTDGYTLSYTFYNAGENTPAIILLHALNGSKADWDAFAKELQANGYSSIAIDLRGNGQSSGDLSSFTAEEYNGMVNDVAAAKEFLKKQKIDPLRIGIIGASIGANIGLKYAATDADIKGIILLSPGLDYQGVKTEDAMKSYGRSLLIVASSTDQYSAKSSQTLYELSPSGDLKFFKVAGHGTEMFNEFTNLDQIILGWLRVNI